jgi:hypothetical protein
MTVSNAFNGKTAMSKRIAILMLITMLAVAGCATGTYHPTKPRSEWANDHRDCERQVRDIIREEPDLYDGGNYNNQFDMNYHSEEQRMIKECMRRKGWTSKRMAGE